MITRSKARSRQSLGSVASPRANPPRRTSTLNRMAQQSSEGVKHGAKVAGGRRSMSLAGGRKRSSGQAHSCRSDCMTCPDLESSLEFSSNVTGRTYSAINISISKIHCKLQNFIYLLTCMCCNIQYVGETIIPMNQRIYIEELNAVAKLQLTTLKMFALGQNFPFMFLKNYPVMDTKMVQEIKTCISVVLKEKIFG